LSALRDFQAGFAAVLMDDEETFAVQSDGKGAIAAQLAGARGQSGTAGLAVYRNTIRANYRRALKESYPVILALIGEDCFNQAADQYSRAVPSVSGDLYDFGASFGDFLSGYGPTRALPYLRHVAALEWAVEAAERAPEVKPLEVSRLAVVAPQRLPGLRLLLHPAARLLASPYPVLHIWQVNQPGYGGEPTVDLGEGGDRLLVTRHGAPVVIERLGAAEYAWLSALAAGETLVSAVARALALDPAFPVDHLLRHHVAAGTLWDFALD
jgi:hypothetical protein